MTYLPVGTHKKGHKNEMFHLQKMEQMNTTVITFFSIIYSTCYECEKNDSLLDFIDHQLDSHFGTNRARPTLEAFKNEYGAAFLS